MVAPIATLVALVATAPVSSDAPARRAQVFRARLDVVRLDVSVVDKNHQPVRGLTADDFTVLENGKKQPIVALSFLDSSDSSDPVSGWMREVVSDVASNTVTQDRLFVLVMDDAMVPQDPWMIQASRGIASSIIDKLGPSDLMAIVFTGDNRRTQDFTSDKARLRTAIDRFNPGLADYRFGTASGGVDVDSWFYLSSIRTLSNLADILASIPNKRKAVFWVSPGIPMDQEDGGPQMAKRGRDAPPVLAPIEFRDLHDKTEELFRRAALANLVIYPIDPTGLGGLRAYLSRRVGDEIAVRKITAMNDYLAMAAANTGGRVVMNVNDFEPGIKDMFQENSSYYLIGFEPLNSNSDGKLRRIEVKVNRPDVEVRSRSGYLPPTASTTRPTSVQTQLERAAAGLLPDGSLPMRVAACVFALPGRHVSSVAIVLGIRQPVPPGARIGRITDTIDLLVRAFTPDGQPRGSERGTARVVIRAGSGGDAEYEILSQIDLPAGRYRLRIAAHNTSSGKSGSAFVDVTVPDYSNLPFSASEITIAASPGLVSAPRNLLSSLIPIVPTTVRLFERTDRAVAFLRLYQSGQEPIVAVRLSISICDRQGQVRFNDTRSLRADDFEFASQQGSPQFSRPGSTADHFANFALRVADVRYQLPVTELPAGPYLLTIDATHPSTAIRRLIRFEVR